jgi:enamine deaminase RidA (YjgF/YER057c/UK114 family)
MRKPGIAVFRLGRPAALNCITLNATAASPAAGRIRNEAENLGAVIVRQCVFADDRQNAATFRKLVSAGPPVTCLKHVFPGKKGFFSSQAIAVSGMRKLRPVRVNGREIGLVCEDEFARYCSLGNVFAQNRKASRSAQAEMVLETFAAALTRHGFRFTDTVRTWFFIERILAWYDEFNRIRTEFFQKHGVFAQVVPASTGIGAGNFCGAALIGNLFAVQPKGGQVKIRAVSSPLQGSALNYKSSFSRAVELAYPAGRALLVSGTAGIRRDGQTAFPGDVVAQIDLTMRVVAALLRSRKMDWKHLFRGSVYFKHPDSVKYFMAYCREHALPSQNLAVAFTDMCRAELLFEIELDAFIAAKEPK